MAENDNIKQKVIVDFDTNAEDASKKVDKLDKAISKTTDSQKKATKETKSTSDALEDMGGSAGRAVGGFKSLIKTMWALVANPIGAVIAAIVLGLTALFKAFTSTKAGGEKFDQVMAGISATIDVVRDRVLKVGAALVKFFTGDFAGALNDARGAVAGFGDEVAAEFKKAADAAKSLQEVADAERDLGVSRAKLNRDLAEAEQILNDTTAAYGDKKNALEKVAVAEQKQTDQELSNAEKKLAAIRAQNALSDSGADALQAEADAQIKVFELQKVSAENQRRVGEFNKKLTSDEAARVKELTAVTTSCS